MLDAEEFVIPAKISIIKTHSFYLDIKLKSIKFELKIIEDNAFSFSGIENALFPESVEVLKEESFQYTSYLKSIKFPSNSKLKKIGVKAFICSKAKSISLPESIG